jgi:hypothetical protein
MKVICISVQDPTQIGLMNNHSYGFITIGKWYDVLGEDLYTQNDMSIPEYNIINDNNDLTNYPKQCFKSLSSVREEKLISLGI